MITWHEEIYCPSCLILVSEHDEAMMISCEQNYYEEVRDLWLEEE